MTTFSKVDRDTGLAIEEQTTFWKCHPTWEQMNKSTKNELPKKQKDESQARDPVVLTNTPSADLKTQAVNLYGQGLGAKEISKLLSITYANAHYYKRFVKNEKAESRLKESLKRV